MRARVRLRRVERGLERMVGGMEESEEEKEKIEELECALARMGRGSPLLP